jgi:23S rRNA (cytosine1962-C5)-methyltransferase
MNAAPAPPKAIAIASAAATATVTSRGAARVREGHPWIFRQDVAHGPETDAATGGPSLVAVRDGRGKTLGYATWAAQAKLALRMVDRGDAPPPPGGLLDVVSRRLDAALARRAAIARERDAYRIAHGESDGLPGLFVDRFAGAAVIQTTSVAMDAARGAIAALVRDRLDARVVVARDDGSARDFEGLPRFAGVVAGGGATTVVYRLGPNQLEADLLTDGKTGGFLDQADNHAAIAALAPPGARCLDAFTSHGGFALALARRGGAVLATDQDPQAVARAAANARRNGLPNLTVEVANAFDRLRALESQGERFDVVVLDPPALAKRGGAAGLIAAERGYKELILRGARLTAPGGLLVACSCSGRVTRAKWDELCAAALGDSGRSAQVVARHGAGRDHPELCGVPETGHLKVWLLRVL